MTNVIGQIKWRACDFFSSVREPTTATWLSEFWCVDNKPEVSVTGISLAYGSKCCVPVYASGTQRPVLRQERCQRFEKKYSEPKFKHYHASVHVFLQNMFMYIFETTGYHSNSAVSVLTAMQTNTLYKTIFKLTYYSSCNPILILVYMTEASHKLRVINFCSYNTIFCVLQLSAWQWRFQWSCHTIISVSDISENTWN